MESHINPLHVLIDLFSGKKYKRKPMTDNNTADKKTSNEWNDEQTDYKILDPDGWDRINFRYSWFEEKITKYEFDSRLMASTVQRLPPVAVPLAPQNDESTWAHNNSVAPQSEFEQADCSKHKKEVAGITDMKLLAEMIGDLHYETLEILFSYLDTKIRNDAAKDLNNERKKLADVLFEAAGYLTGFRTVIRKAWQISKPFMRTTPAAYTVNKTEGGK